MYVKIKSYEELLKSGWEINSVGTLHCPSYDGTRYVSAIFTEMEPFLGKVREVVEEEDFNFRIPTDSVWGVAYWFPRTICEIVIDSQEEIEKISEKIKDEIFTQPTKVVILNLKEEDKGRKVLWCGQVPEPGEIVSWNKRFVFVRFYNSRGELCSTFQACDPRDLKFLD